MYVVTGGADSAGNTLSSTETMTPGASQWQFAGQLPSARKAMRGVSIGGSFFVTGEFVSYAVLVLLSLLSHHYIQAAMWATTSRARY